MDGNERQPPDQSVADLAWAWQTGEMTGEQFAELARRLDDDAVLAEYVAFVSDTTALSRAVARVEDCGGHDVALPADEDPLSAGTPHPPAAGSNSSSAATDGGSLARGGGDADALLPNSLSGRGVKPWISHVVVAALACAATIAVLAVSGDRQHADAPPRGGAAAAIAPAAPDPAVYVATLTGAVDCQWASHLQTPEYGKPLEAGRRLQLNAGLAQLTFDNGAKVIVQGPAEFTVKSAAAGELRTGKLTALVPPQAVGFQVGTPTAEVVDLGTEFGLDVADGGETEVHVFTGEVVFWRKDARAAEQHMEEGIHLFEDQAAFVSATESDEELAEVRVADASKFVRRIVPRLSGDELPALPVTDQLALWLAADVLVKTDDAERVIAWRDIAAGDNQTEEDAWQHDVTSRPLLVRNALGGLPAVRFDGQSTYLVTTPLKSTEDQTLHIVFSRREAKTPVGFMRQLINYNGPPFALAGYDDSFRVLQIDDSEAPGRLWVRYFAGVEADNRIFNVGSTSTRDIVSANRPHLLTYRYATDANQSQLWLDGQLQSQDGAPPFRDYLSRKVLGRHPQQQSFFDGDLGEVLIFNGALTDEENQAVMNYLQDKYSIKSPAPLQESR